MYLLIKTHWMPIKTMK